MVECVIWDHVVIGSNPVAQIDSLFYWRNNMDINREYNNIESSFAMEDLIFDEECAKRVKSVLSGELSVQDAIAELNEKYKKNCKSVRLD